MNCPFSKEECNNSCPLYISPDDLNEFVVARLSSIGVMNKTQSGGASSVARRQTTAQHFSRKRVA